MNPASVRIKSYLPPEKRSRSKLQQVKDKHRSFTQTNNEGIPKDLNELKLIKYREHAISFLNQYMNIDKKTSKTQYCKTNHISHNSLNTGLKQLGYKVRVKETNLDQYSPTETNQDQSRSIETDVDVPKTPQTKAKAKSKKLKKDKEISMRDDTIKAGTQSYNFDETFNKVIDSF